MKLEQKQREGIAEARSGRRSLVRTRRGSVRQRRLLCPGARGCRATLLATQSRRLLPRPCSAPRPLQGSVLGSGAAGIVCAAAALATGDPFLWRVRWSW